MAPSLSFGSRPISSSISVASIFISVLILTFGIVTLNSLVPFRDLVGPVLSSHHDHIGSSSGGSSGGSSGSLLATSSRLTLFTEHHEYKNMSHEHDYLWQELLGPNGGFLKKVDQDKKFHSYGISMFHQLHCLQMIRGAVQGLLEENAMTRMNHSEKTERETMDEHEHEHEHDHATGSGGDDPHKGHLDSRHWLHCFDYLRQAILCHADETVEPPKTRPNGEPVVDGMGERICKDWSLLYKAAVLSELEPEPIEWVTVYGG